MEGHSATHIKCVNAIVRLIIIHPISHAMQSMIGRLHDQRMICVKQIAQGAAHHHIAKRHKNKNNH
jgi:hypothetical protein